MYKVRFYLKYRDYLHAHNQWLKNHNLLYRMLILADVKCAFGTFNHNSKLAKIDLESITIALVDEKRIIAKIIEAIVHENLHCELGREKVIDQEDVVRYLIKYLELEEKVSNEEYERVFKFRSKYK